MSRDDLFKINAGIVRDLAKGCAEFCPKAFILVISNPVNSTVPIAAEILKSQNVFDAKRLFGVTTLDVVRAETFVAEILGEKNPQNLTIPVIGGHSGETIVPLFSQIKSGSKIPEDKLDALVNRGWLMILDRQRRAILIEALLSQACNLVATRWSRPRTEQDQRLCPWHMLDSGTVFYAYEGICAPG